MQCSAVQYDISHKKTSQISGQNLDHLCDLLVEYNGAGLQVFRYRPAIPELRQMFIQNQYGGFISSGIRNWLMLSHDWLGFTYIS